MVQGRNTCTTGTVVKSRLNQEVYLGVCVIISKCQSLPLQTKMQPKSFLSKTGPDTIPKVSLLGAPKLRNSVDAWSKPVKIMCGRSLNTANGNSQCDLVLHKDQPGYHLRLTDQHVRAYFFFITGKSKQEKNDMFLQEVMAGSSDLLESHHFCEVASQTVGTPAKKYSCHIQFPLFDILL